MSNIFNPGSTASGSGHTIRENGTDQTARTGLNFIDVAAGVGLITDDAVGDETEVNLTLYLLASGARALTADWDAGSFEIRAQTFESDVVTGTAPLVIASTTKVTNLNADLLDDQSGAFYLDSANFTGTNWTDLTDGGATTLHSHAGASAHTIRENGTDQTARTGLNFVDASAGLGLITDDAIGDETEVNLNLYLLADGVRALTADWDAGSFEIRAQTFESDVATGTAPLVIASTTKVTNLNADLLDDQSGAFYLDSANFTGTNWTDLTDGGATTLHSHAGGGSPGGLDTQVQFNDAGSFGGDAGLVYNKTTNVLTAGEIIDSGLTADRLVVSDGSKQLVSTITSANLAASISDETGTAGKAVFDTDPTLIRAVMSGTPAAQGAIGYNTTRDTVLQYDNAWGASLVFGLRVPIISRPNETLTNTVATDQDFTSLGNIPANFIIAQRVIRITLILSYTSDGVASAQASYLKLGTTKVAAGNSVTPGNNETRAGVMQYYVFGTAAAGAAANVDTANVVPANINVWLNSGNSVAQPVALATNGALAIVPGVTFASTAGTDTRTLISAMVEVLN